MIATTPYEIEIVRRVQRGELCARVLDGGDLCGRPIHPEHRGEKLCRWHWEAANDKPHADDDDPFEKVNGQKVCVRCHKRPVAFRVTRLCGNCQKVTHRQHVVSDRRRETK